EPDGSMTVMKIADGEASPLFVIPYEDALTTSILGFDAANEHVYAVDSRGRDKAALVRIDAETAAVEVIAEDDMADISGLMTHPTEYRPEAYAVNYLRTEWTALDDRVAQDLAFLNERLEGEIAVGSRTRDDSTWLVANFSAEE